MTIEALLDENVRLRGAVVTWERAARESAHRETEARLELAKARAALFVARKLLRDSGRDPAALAAIVAVIGEDDTAPPSDPAAVSPTAVREAVETLVGEAPVLVPGADYIVRMDRDGTPIWWVSQDVLAHWTPDRSRASRLTIEGADGLADAYAAEGATVERWESVGAAELAGAGLAEGPPPAPLHMGDEMAGLDDAGSVCGIAWRYCNVTLDRAAFGAASNKCAECAEKLAEAPGGR